MLAILIFPGCQNQNKVNDEDKIPKILDELIIENNVPGINLSIIYKNGKQTNYSAGVADTSTKVPLTTQHVMFSGSIGKTYAVAILMQLVDEGKIDLEEKFITYFPDNQWLKRLPNINDITVEMLLQHTTGLPRYIENQAVWDTLKASPDKIWTYEDRLSNIYDSEPVHEADKGWAYSDTNYILLGMLIEKITGSYYYDEVENRILKPYGLTYTYPAITREINNLPTGYSDLGDFFRMPGVVVVDGKYAFNPQMEWTGGGMVSTTSDLAKWSKLYFEGELFSPELLTKITTPNSNGIEIDKGLSYGTGSFIYNTKFGKAYGHTGFVPGFVSIFAYYPDKRIAVALQVNCDYAKKKMELTEYLDWVFVGG